MSYMLTGESLFHTFAAATSVAAQTSSTDAFKSNDVMLQEAPKLGNNDLLLENLDLNLIIDANQSDDVQDDIFSSVFNTDDENLLTTSPASSVDDDMQALFDFTVAPTVKEESLVAETEDIFASFVNEIETRSKSTSATIVPAAIDSSFVAPAVSKRSFSTANLESAQSTSNKKVDLGCTPYTRKQRASPLPPVVAKGEDVASLKRARNTEAARRSRARKMERMSQLEEKCEGLMKENESLKAQIEQLQFLLANKN